MEDCRVRVSPSAWLIVALLVIVGAGWAGAGSAEARTLLPQCQDHLDNDGDGEVDFPDEPGCSSAADTTEINTGSLPACSDRVDNDGDGRVDFPDEPGCDDGAEDSESGGGGRACAEGIDNDGDGATDYPADPGCASASDRSEANTAECSDGIDNDGDGRIDWRGHDFGCASATSLSETDPPQCNDGRDNDGDGAVDHEQDSDCSSATDALEGPNPACSDGRDNDGDAKIDFPADPGCSFAGDGDETDAVVYSLPTGPGTNLNTGTVPSTSPQVASRTPLLSPFPIVRLRGRVDRIGTRITLLTVRAPAKSQVSVYCTGKSCPRRRYAVTLARSLVRVRRFEKRLKSGTTLRIYVTRPGFIGKYTRFRFLNRRVPLRADRCSITAGIKPQTCPSS
ncbi:MAG TPA: hypothetical protein VNA28_10425 [Solirubrobacteraceae bacterium]|nr:hypothetical protein [Solirubrobacteraceae bacterium]